jgi:hypothetical protein
MKEKLPRSKVPWDHPFGYLKKDSSGTCRIQGFWTQVNQEN